MKFGSTDISKLDSIDFRLPADHEDTSRVLKEAKTPARVYIGCGKWGIKEWVGNIYPEGTKEKDFLDAYQSRFNSIELNNTFYRLSRSAISSWVKAVDENEFKFCPKWSRRVSHIKRLKDPEENTDYFVESCYLFGNSLGTTFLQLPENFGPKYIERFEPFLKLIPEDIPLQIELRNEEWYKGSAFDEVCSILKNYKTGLVITDTATRRDVIHQRLLTDTVFIRFNGYGLHKTDFTRLDDWVKRIKIWFDRGLWKCYFFCHQQDESNTPETCRYLIRKLNEKIDAGLKVP